MENIKRWFEKQKELNPGWENVLDKIIEGISDRGFVGKQMNQLIEKEFSKIKTEYDSQFIQDIDDNAQGDSN